MSKKGSQSALSEDQVDEFKDIFEMFDVSRTGSISKDDLKQVCSQFGKASRSQASQHIAVPWPRRITSPPSSPP
jgi:Ca2+-binding EF-hand superfamily protein